MNKSDTRNKNVSHLFFNEKIILNKWRINFHSFQETISNEPVPGNIGGELSINLSS